MGLMDWFSALSRGDEKSVQAARSSLQGAIAEDSTIDGLDFIAAVDAHRKWKVRLTAYVQGTSTEKLDHAVICRDDQCTLGKWIYSQGANLMADVPIYHQLKAKHAQFHVTASRVVELVQKGEKDAAQNLLMGEEYTRGTVEVQRLLSKLYGQMKDS